MFSAGCSGGAYRFELNTGLKVESTRKSAEVGFQQSPLFSLRFLFSANTSTQTMGPRPAAAAAAATPAVRTVPQYKYAAGVRNPQQHLNTQPQVAMQQVNIITPNIIGGSFRALSDPVLG